MLYLARLYDYLDIMVLVLLVIVVAIISVRISIAREEKLYGRRIVSRIEIRNNIKDPTVRISSLKLIPGTGFAYTPVYAYEKKGVEYTTKSYIKCKLNTMHNLRKGRIK